MPTTVQVPADGQLMAVGHASIPTFSARVPGISAGLVQVPSTCVIVKTRRAKPTGASTDGT